MTKNEIVIWEEKLKKAGVIQKKLDRARKMAEYFELAVDSGYVPVCKEDENFPSSSIGAELLEWAKESKDCADQLLKMCNHRADNLRIALAAI